MKKVLFVLGMLFTVMITAQNKGSLSGVVLDKEMNNEPLPFANVFIKGTTIGATTDFDGNFVFEIEEGNYIVVFSFIGYQTVEVPVIVLAGENKVVNQVLEASEGMALDEVEVKATVSKEKESALLAAQKKAVVIKESIGAQRLAKIGVSNAASATSKISGVTKNESSGSIFIRGLGDRYLSTTMNRLPIPSDDVENKNIDLNLFSTDIIKNVSISKTYSTVNYADQSSGNVDIVSKEFSGNKFSIGLSSGVNTNVLKKEVRRNFKTTLNKDDLNLGFYTKKYTLVDAITNQGWDTKTQNSPLDHGVSFSGGQKFQLFGKDLSVFLTGSHSASFNHKKGIFKSFRSNILDNSFTDAETFSTKINTTGLFHIKYWLNEDHKIKFNSLFVNKAIDNLYEQGRNGEGFVFDQDPAEYGAFVRDQNLKQTRMMVIQLLGNHTITENNKLNWAIGYNYVNSEEPNRIRNEVNILDANTVQFAHVGDFQQRKSSQDVEDKELNGYVEDQITFGKSEEQPFKLNIGVNFRRKERAFNSLFVGVRAKGFQVSSIDNLSEAFIKSNFNNRSLVLRERNPDTYNATLEVVAGYANLDFGFEKFSGNVGLRYEADKIDVSWDVANYVGRVGSLSNSYGNVLPSLNLKYEINELNFVRVASSFTMTLPEFKELAPFEYVSPTGRVTKGNPNLEASKNYNLDVKWELFPTSKEIVSLTGFYKAITDPINLAQARGSSGNFVFANTGKKANIYGLEFETRLNLVNTDDNNLNLNLNATKMWFQQDLLADYQYKGKTESDLQGASDFILNTALSYQNYQENEFVATVAANYSSDKIFALGSPEDFVNSLDLYNDEIIEKGFLAMDLVVSKKVSKNLSFKLTGKNLLNPDIKQTQKVRNLSTGIETNETVRFYKKGNQLSLGVKYVF